MVYVVLFEVTKNQGGNEAPHFRLGAISAKRQNLFQRGLLAFSWCLLDAFFPSLGKRIGVDLTERRVGVFVFFRVAAASHGEKTEANRKQNEPFHKRSLLSNENARHENFMPGEISDW